MMNRYKHYVWLCLLAAGGMASCTKKTDFSYNNQVNTSADAPSSIRIVNLRGATEMMLNGQQLTAFLKPGAEGAYGPDETRGTTFFPDNGRMGAMYTLPQRLVNAQGMAVNMQFASFNNNWGFQLTRGFNAKDDLNHPTDYYYTFFSPNAGAFADSMFAIPRSISSPATPDHFKIRLLNLSSDIYANKGAMQLTLANGTPVQGLGPVQPGAYSDYIELPYGTYQFRVLTADGHQVPGVGGSADGLDVIEQTYGTMLLPSNYFTQGINGFLDSKLTFASLKTYQPGGVYTVVVADCPNFKYSTGNSNGETIAAKQNGFRIINDVEPQNITYARLQAVNVLPGKKIKLQVDGQAPDTSLGFAVASAYDRYITGTHILKVMDDAGTVLATRSLLLSPGDNLSAWVYADKNGNPAISMVANNLSATYYGGATDDGTYSALKVEDPSWIRFMNFCADLPEVTFTMENGQLFNGASATQHILLGAPVVSQPYAMLRTDFYNNFQAYASQSNVLPGDLLRNIQPLKSRQFIANPALYTSTMPYSEPGVYTVALVGTLDAGKPGSEQARMIIIKHNQ